MGFLVGAGLGDGGLLDAGIELGELLRGRGLLLAQAFEFAGNRFVPVGGGFLIDLVAGAIGAQAGDVTLELQDLELSLLQLLFELGGLGFDDRELAVAILEHGVGAAEQGELHLFILRASVDLRGQLVELHVELAQTGARRLQAVGQTGALDQGKIGGVLGLFFFRTQIENRLLGLLHALVELGATGFLAFKGGLLLLQVGAAGLGGGAQLDNLLLQMREGGTDLGVVVTVMGQRKVAQAPDEFFVAQRLGCLTAQRTDLAGNFRDHVGHTDKIGVGES